jgi:hypothetical protein
MRCSLLPGMPSARSGSRRRRLRQVVDDIDITVASTITPGEMAVLEKALRKLNAWAVVSTGAPSVCAEPARAG